MKFIKSTDNILVFTANKRRLNSKDTDIIQTIKTQLETIYNINTTLSQKL